MAQDVSWTRRPPCGRLRRSGPQGPHRVDLMARRPAVVLYEDARGRVVPFGLHRLIVACVADRTLNHAWALEDRIRRNPRNGNARFLQTCRSVTDGLLW